MKRGELDRATLSRARAGDPQAFRALYEHHADAVFGFLFRMLCNRSAAEDVLQDTFLRVLQAIGRFEVDGPARLSTWILCIARRLALNVIARAQTARRADQESARAQATTAVALAAPAELRVTLESAIAALPETLRSAFVLREGCALSYEEIATVEAIDLGTVKSRLHRARAALAASLSAEPGAESDDDELDPREELAHEPARASR